MQLTRKNGCNKTTELCWKYSRPFGRVSNNGNPSTVLFVNGDKTGVDCQQKHGKANSGVREYGLIGEAIGWGWYWTGGQRSPGSGSWGGERRTPTVSHFCHEIKCQACRALVFHLSVGITKMYCVTTGLPYTNIQQEYIGMCIGTRNFFF